MLTFKKLSARIDTLNRMKTFKVKELIVKVYKSLIEPSFYNFNLVWDGNKHDKVQKKGTRKVPASSCEGLLWLNFEEAFPGQVKKD